MTIKTINVYYPKHTRSLISVIPFDKQLEISTKNKIKGHI